MYGYSLQAPYVNSFVSLYSGAFYSPSLKRRGETIILDVFVDQYFLMTHQQKNTIFRKHFRCFVSRVSARRYTAGLVVQELRIAPPVWW